MHVHIRTGSQSDMAAIARVHSRNWHNTYRVMPALRMGGTTRRGTSALGRHKANRPKRSTGRCGRGGSYYAAVFGE